MVSPRQYDTAEASFFAGKFHKPAAVSLSHAQATPAVHHINHHKLHNHKVANGRHHLQAHPAQHDRHSVALPDARHAPTPGRRPGNSHSLRGMTSAAVTQASDADSAPESNSNTSAFLNFMAGGRGNSMHRQANAYSTPSAHETASTGHTGRASEVQQTSVNPRMPANSEALIYDTHNHTISYKGEVLASKVDSGNMAGLNNWSMQAESNKGPTPRGTYNIAWGGHGPESRSSSDIFTGMRINPAEKGMADRPGLFIHSVHLHHNGRVIEGSNGCTNIEDKKQYASVVNTVKNNHITKFQVI